MNVAEAKTRPTKGKKYQAQEEYACLACHAKQGQPHAWDCPAAQDFIAGRKFGIGIVYRTRSRYHKEKT